MEKPEVYMRRHHKNANLKKHRGNPHGNAPEQKAPIARKNQSMNGEAIRKKQ